MAVKVYGMNHIALEVTDISEAVRFYREVFDLPEPDAGEGQAFFRIGEHQFIALFKVDRKQPDDHRHFGIIVTDDDEIARVRERVQARGLALTPGFACDFRDPWGNRIQVVDLSVSSPYWRLGRVKMSEERA
ncbi:MAG TPA: VOC family protein [Armatimonadetes bacterium]|jgi:catechol 2,3-dioxygenase-like lactoylglutathione lyase family enzyme|nr:VOC family protein [Armatimonadota bacterium]